LSDTAPPANAETDAGGLVAQAAAQAGQRPTPGAEAPTFAGIAAHAHSSAAAQGVSAEAAAGTGTLLETDFTEAGAVDSTSRGKRTARATVAITQTGTANPGAGQAASTTPALECAGDIGAAICAETAAEVGQDGSSLDETGADQSARSGISRAHQRRNAPLSGNAPSDLQNGLPELAANGVPNGVSGGGAARVVSEVASLAQLLGDSGAALLERAADLAATAANKVAALEGTLSAESSTAAASLERLADSLAEHDSGPGKPGVADSGSTGQSVHAADRLRFVQRVLHALQAAEARGTAVRLRLSPPDLGSLKLELSVRKDALIARMEVETAAARALLLDNLQQLRERLAAQEIKIERFEVDFVNHHAGD
jgi:flagellar hook-length control protein FliK